MAREAKQHVMLAKPWGLAHPAPYLVERCTET
jgi:hypothetical protein